jgi:hypothetical protein
MCVYGKIMITNRVFLQYYIYRVAEEERGENELASMYFHSLLGKRFNSRNQ